MLFIKDLGMQSIGTKGNKTRVWLVQCECGHKQESKAQHIKSGDIKQCKKCSNEARVTHGDSKTKLYRTLRNMKQRCYNDKSPDYEYYGAKGVTVCDAWLDSYEEFKVWAMSNGYSDSLTIERENSNGNYEPANCSWITQSDNTFRARSKQTTYADVVTQPKRRS